MYNDGDSTPAQLKLWTIISVFLNKWLTYDVPWTKTFFLGLDSEYLV